MSSVGQAKRPNVVFVMTDEHNLRGLSCYRGTVCQTPAVDRIAHEGVLFENTYCSYPVCMPSRAAFMTGRYPHVNGVTSNGISLPRTELHLPGLFKVADYKTALCGKNHCFDRVTLEAAFDFMVEAEHRGLKKIPEEFPYRAKQAMQYYRDMRPRVNSTFGHDIIPFEPEVCDAALITDAAIRFVDAAGSQPFFLWLSYPGPHWPFTCPERYADLFPPGSVDMPPADDLGNKPDRQQAARRLLGLDKATEGDFRKIISIYYGHCRYIDDQIARFSEALEQRRIGEDTILCFTSDHGDYLGEHGLMHKSCAVYDCLTKIPFIWRWPGHITAGGRCSALAEAVDLLPTVLDLCDLEAPPGVQGISHARTLLGQAPYDERETCFCECGTRGEALTCENLADADLPDGPYAELKTPAHYWCGRIKMIRTRRWKLGYYGAENGELYDMDTDLWELNNLYGSLKHKDIVYELKEKLLQWTIETEDHLPPMNGDPAWSVFRERFRNAGMPLPEG